MQLPQLPRVRKNILVMAPRTRRGEAPSPQPSNKHVAQLLTRMHENIFPDERYRETRLLPPHWGETNEHGTQPVEGIFLPQPAAISTSGVTGDDAMDGHGGFRAPYCKGRMLNNRSRQIRGLGGQNPLAGEGGIDTPPAKRRRTERPPSPDSAKKPTTIRRSRPLGGQPRHQGSEIIHAPPMRRSLRKPPRSSAIVEALGNKPAPTRRASPQLSKTPPKGSAYGGDAETKASHASVIVTCDGKTMSSSLPNEVLDPTGPAFGTKSVLSWTHLPMDIFSLIIDRLMLTRHGSPEEERKARLGLRGLALACRGLHKLATEALYHSIYISDGRTATRLIHSLTHQPKQRRLIRELIFLKWLGPDFIHACQYEFGVLKWELETMETWERAVLFFGECGSLAAPRDVPWRQVGLGAAELYSAIQSRLGPSVLVALLCFTPWLETLRLTVPPRPRALFLYHVGTLLSRANEWPEIRTLPRLSTLAMSEVKHAMQGPDLRWIPLFTSYSEIGIRRLELEGADLENTDLYKLLLASNCPLSKVKVLHLSRMAIKGNDWDTICTAFPRLKELNISVASMGNKEIIPAKHLDGGLLKIRDTLEYLCIRREYISTCLFDVGGPQRILSCLPSLKKLTHLDIPTILLFNKPEDMARKCISQVLPSSVQFLGFQEQWDAGYDLRFIAEFVGLEHYRFITTQFLKNVAWDKSSLPNLKGITFLEKWKCWRVGHMARDLVSMMDGRVTFTALDAQGGKVDLLEEIAEPAFDIEDEGDVEDEGDLAEDLIL